MDKRQQVVSVDGEISSKLNIKCGVTQGSILGPQLFILYINDICNVSDVLKFVLFADDTNIFCSHNSISSLCRIIEDELVKLNIWFAVNKLSLNLEKTNFMFFSNTRSHVQPKITINNTLIERVNVTKFLGVMIDEKLNWKKHIQYVHSKLCKCISIIYRASKTLTRTALVILYYSLFYPYMSYCIEVWGGAYNSNLRSIYLKQKHVIRVICKTNRLEHTSSLFSMLKILKFNDVVILKTATVMFNGYRSLLPSNIQRLLELQENNRRSQKVFRLKFARTTLKQHCLSFYGVKLWNSLPLELRMSGSINIFKEKLKKEIFHSYNFLN